MHIKRFEASSLLEAIQLVKAELGPEALILSQKSVRRDRGRFGLFGRSIVEVTAAVDREVRRGQEEPAGRVAPDPSWRSFELTRALVDPLESEVRELRRAVESLARALPERDDLARDVDALRRVALDLRRDAGTGVCEPGAGLLAGRLLAAGVAPRHAFPLARDASDDALAEGPAPALARALSSRLDGRLRAARADDGLRADLFVGPTGAGKTTTLAKLAVRGEAGGGPLAIVTTDALRIGAEAPLRGYARRVGAPFRVAASPAELGRAASADSSRRILVDTAGRSPADRRAMAELLECRARLGPRARVNLVLPCIAKDQDLAAELERFRPLAPDRLVFTKLDESRSVGNLVNLLLDPDSPPLAWITDGQRVPEDLRVPDPEALAARVLGEAV